MTDRTRRLFSALPRDIERLWIISQNAKELKEDIMVLRAKVKKYRDEAMSAWRESEKKAVHCDKWGIPCAAPPKIEDVKETFEESKEKTGTQVEQDHDHIWTIPLDEKNSEVQVVMKISPRKAIVKKYTTEEGDGVEAVEKEQQDDCGESKPMPIVSNSPETNSEDPNPTNNAGEELNVNGVNSSSCVVDLQTDDTSEDVDGEDDIKSRSDAENLESSDKHVDADDRDIIRVHVEASAKTRNQVKISFGSETIPVGNQDKYKVWNGIHTPSPANFCLPCSGMAAHSIAHVEDIEERKAKKRRQQRYRKKYKVKKSTKKEEKEQPTNVSSHRIIHRQNSKHLDTKPETKEKIHQVIEFKTLVKKSKEKLDLHPGVALYPFDQATSNKEDKSVLNKKKITAKKRRSYLYDLDSYVHERKKREGEDKNTSNISSGQSSMAFRVNYTRDNKQSFTPYDAADPIDSDVGTAGATIKIFSQSKGDDGQLENSINIEIPKRSLQETFNNNLPNQQSCNELKKSPKKPFLKRILDTDCDKREYVGKYSSRTSSKRTVIGNNDTLQDSLKEEKLQVSCETLQAIKSIINQIDTRNTENNPFKDMLTIVASRNLDNDDNDNDEQSNEDYEQTNRGDGHDNDEQSKEDNEQTNRGAPVDKSTRRHISTPGFAESTRKEVNPSEEPNISSFLEASLWTSSTQKDNDIPESNLRTDNMNTSDLEVSFLGVPVMSSTHHGDIDIPDDFNIEECTRRSVWSTSLDTNRVSSYRLGSDYSNRFRILDPVIGADWSEGAAYNHLVETVPVRYSSKDALILAKRRDCEKKDSSGREGKKSPGFRTSQFSLDDSKSSRESDFTKYVRTEGESGTRYNTLKIPSTKYRRTTSDHESHEHIKNRIGLDTGRKQSSQDQVQVGRESKFRNAQEQGQSDHRHPYRRSVESESHSYGNREDRSNRDRTGISNDSGEKRNNGRYHSPERKCGQSSEKSLKSKDSFTGHRSPKSRGEYRIRGIFNEYKQHGNGRPHLARQEYSTTAEYTNDGNGSGSVHIDSAMTHRDETFSSSAHQSSVDNAMTVIHVSMNNNQRERNQTKDSQRMLQDQRQLRRIAEYSSQRKNRPYDVSESPHSQLKPKGKKRRSKSREGYKE